MRIVIRIELEMVRQVFSQNREAAKKEEAVKG
jgi:hypothetical protein